MLSLILVLLVLQAPGPKPVPYYDPAGRLPSTHAEYAADRVETPFQSSVVQASVGIDGYDDLVLVFVNASLQPAIQAELDTYVADLSAEGFGSKVIAVSGGRPADLRQVLQVHQDSGLVGGLMVGDLPVAWWEDGSRGEDYPLELFFTDLDGTFSDSDGDGKYDSHSGSRAPDIWIGRIHASRLTYGSEEQLVRDLFHRNHDYRTGQLMIQHRGLVYNEVDWYPHDHGMSSLYSDVTMFNDENTTTAYHYKGQLQLGYEFVHIIAHSSPWVHTFFLQNEVPGGGSVFNFEITALEPHGAFYFMNACICARYTEKDNLGNWYLFARPWGQAVIAATNLMYGVSYLTTVYRALDNDSCLGDAFLKWHKANYSMQMGTCILGDPTLRIADDEGRMTNATPAVQRSPSGSPLDWTEYVVDSSNFVNGNPAIGCSDGRLRIVFDSGRKVRADTYWSWFNGTSFNAPESVAWHAYYDLFPVCVTDATGRFWVVWQSFRDYQSGYEHFQLLSSFYHNGTWSSLRRVGSLAGYHDVQAALGAGTDDKVWCAFKSFRNGQADIWVSSASSGGDWAAPIRLTDDSLGQIAPCVAVDSANHPWVFWSSLTGGNWHIQGRHHDGSGWLPMFELDTIGNNSSPCVAARHDGTIWVLWHKWIGNQSDIYGSCWDGAVWTEPAPVTSDPAEDILPDICLAPDGEFWACWQSKRTGDWDIHASRYEDGWTTPEPVTADVANDWDPVIGADSVGVWIAWASDRRGYWNIYASHTNLTGVADPHPAAPGRQSVVRVSPNPFRNRAVFTGTGEFRVDVYSADGRLVTRLNAISGQAVWTPRDVRPGLYFARVNGPGLEAVLKLTCVDRARD
jgi:hypothetical protein